jgi:hypothetical protein
MNVRVSGISGLPLPKESGQRSSIKFFPDLYLHTLSSSLNRLVGVTLTRSNPVT